MDTTTKILLTVAIIIGIGASYGAMAWYPTREFIANYIALPLFTLLSFI